jgi:hypothetical protein
MCILEAGFNNVCGFVPGSLGAPKIPVVSNHQSALLAVAPEVANLTKSSTMLKSAKNGSVVVRDALPARERITNQNNWLMRPGQKPIGLVSRR